MDSALKVPGFKIDRRSSIMVKKSRLQQVLSTVGRGLYLVPVSPVQDWEWVLPPQVWWQIS
jgi:hypothetical protein